MRICPKCDKKWYSADESSEWICDECGEVLKPDLNKDVE